MDCSYYEELLSARRDGELTPDEAMTLEKHLRECPVCRKTAQIIDAVGGVVASLEKMPLPGKIEEAIVSGVRRERAASIENGRQPRYYRIPRPVAWAAVVLMLILGIGTLSGPVGDMFFRGGRNRQPSAPEVQKIILTENDVISVNGRPVQKITLSETDVIMTRTVSGQSGKS